MPPCLSADNSRLNKQPWLNTNISWSLIESETILTKFLILSAGQRFPSFCKRFLFRVLVFKIKTLRKLNHFLINKSPGETIKNVSSHSTIFFPIYQNIFRSSSRYFIQFEVNLTEPFFEFCKRYPFYTFFFYIVLNPSMIKSFSLARNVHQFSSINITEVYFVHLSDILLSSKRITQSLHFTFLC